MSNVYKKIELVGSSQESVEDAIRGAISKAGESIKHLEWFEVDEIRGWIKDGEVMHFQVGIHVGFKIEDGSDANTPGNAV